MEVTCSSPYDEKPRSVIFMPGWIYDSLVAQGVNIVKAFRDGKVYEFLSRDQRLDIEALSNAPWLLNATFREGSRSELREKLPVSIVTPFAAFVLHCMGHTVSGCLDPQYGAEKSVEREYFADMLVEQRFVSVFRRLFTMTGDGWLSADDTWQVKEVKENFYELIAIDNRMLVVIREGFFVPINKPEAGKIFCEDLYRGLVAAGGVVELARLPDAHMLIKTLMLP